MPPLLIGVVGGPDPARQPCPGDLRLPGVDAAFIDMDAYYKDLTHLTMEERRRSTSTTRTRSTLQLMADHLAAAPSRGIDPEARL
jgi:hypothetical protein